MELYNLSLIITSGLVCGSFLNVLIYRLPKKESFIFTRSKCPNCNYSIPLYKNIPLLSFLLQFGKCSNCKLSISLQYPIVEISSVFIWYWAAYSLSLYDAILFIIISNILIVISFIDYKTMQINLSLIIFAFISLFIYSFLNPHHIINMIFGSLVGFGYLGSIFLITSFIFKKETLGYGDLLLIIILGAWIGPGNVLFAIFLSSLIGIITWMGINIFYGYNANRPLPFAPFLSLSSIFTYIIQLDVYNYLLGF